MLQLFPSRTVVLQILSFQIHWYGVMYVLAFVIAVLLLPHLQRRRSLSLTTDQWLSLISWTVIGVLVGGRLGFVLLYEPAYYFSHPLQILAVWQGGMASHGGFIGVILALWILTAKEGIPKLALGDIVVVPAAIGLALGRVGNFINGELYGPMTSLPWAIQFPDVIGARHPTQLYECVADLGIAAICWLWLRRKRVTNGQNFALFLMLYGIARFLLEYVREQQYPVVTIASIALTRGQLYTIPLFLAGLALWMIAPRLSRGKDAA